STACRSWPMPSKTPAAPTLTSWAIAEAAASMCAGVGWWIWCWERSEAVTNKEWLECTNPGSMFRQLQEPSERQFRLFASACCRFLPQYDNPAFRQAIDLAENCADRPVEDKTKEKDLKAAAVLLDQACPRSGECSWFVYVATGDNAWFRWYM